MKIARHVAAQLWLAALVTPALALDWTPDAARILGDPSYLPTAGQIFGRFDYTYSAELYDFSTTFGRVSGPPPSSFDRSGNAFLPQLDYGITDDLTVFANLGWGNTRNREAYIAERLVFPPLPGRRLAASVTPTVNASGIYSPNPLLGSSFVNPFPLFRIVRTPETAHFRALGADNPVFGLTWRAIDQAHAPISVDLTGSYTPDIFQSRSAGVDQTGTLPSGGQAGSAQIAISRETRALTLRVFGTFSYEGRRNELAIGETEDGRSAPHPSYAAGLQSQLRLLPWLAINAGVTAQQSVQFDRFDISRFGTSVDLIKPAGVISPYAGIVVPLIDQHLVVEAQYQHDFVDNETVHSESGAENRFFDQESNLFTARVLFAFGGVERRSIAELWPPANNAPAPAPARTYLVFFDWDRADLTERARQIVAEAAQAAERAPTRLDVRGYTDLSGTAAYNQRLSERRARSVEAELVRDGVPRDEISVRGLGESSPLVPTAPGVREPQNRRVEIIIR